MTTIDFTKPLALRSDPYTQFKGPLIGPDDGGWYTALHHGRFRFWPRTGRYNPNFESNADLIPLQVCPVKWRTSTGNIDGEPIPMIERAPVDALVEALRQIAREPWILQGPIARDALAAWEAGL